MHITELNAKIVYTKSILSWVLFTCIAGYAQMTYVFKIETLKPLYFLTPSIVGLIFGVLTAQIILISHRLKLSSIRDSLTQSFNHGYYRDMLNNWCDGRAVFSLILIDADYFKNINDQHGHKVGDQILIRLSEVVNKTKRIYDIFARHGGEEFVLLAPRTDLKSATELASRLREAIDKAPMPADIHLTCSFGVAQYRANSDTPDSLFERADNAMYVSKAKGRNCVTVELPVDKNS